MKKILITGANSYIGTSFENYIKENYPGAYKIDTVDMLDASWRDKDFSGYDSVFHVAGIAHADVGKVSEEGKKLYYTVNTELTLEVAGKAKAEGVPQFIFMSSMIVYSGCKDTIITSKTEPKPLNFYGDSKLLADVGVRELSNETFKVVVLRPPMIYGKGSKGNYAELSKLATKLPVFPVVKNKRSMLYIENLCRFIKLMIDNNENGVFFPQNSEYTVTSTMVKLIAKAKDSKIFMVPGFYWALKILMLVPGKIGGLSKKAFGDLAYDLEMSEYKEEYATINLEESIKRTEE